MFANKNILITGATSGIGKSLLDKILLQKPKKVFILARNLEKCKYFTQKHHNCIACYLDLSDKKSIDSLKLNTKLDYLFFNAGIGISEKSSPLKVNFFHHIYLFNNIKKNCLTKNTLIMNTTSALGKRYEKKVNKLIQNIQQKNLDQKIGNKFVEYCMSKKGNHAFTLYLHQHSINAISVHPGLVNTKIFTGKQGWVHNILMKFIKPISVDESSDYFMEAMLHFESGAYYEKGKINYSFPNSTAEIAKYLDLV
jgi:NAD(P)-dependent dehydrogenase (short-subunit alcohol dehydrogenase family)